MNTPDWPPGTAESARIGRERMQALERDAQLWRELTNQWEASVLEGKSARTEALRRTARGAVEDWLEAKGPADGE